MKGAGLALACFLAAGPAAALQDSRLDWGRRDTKLHLGVSFGASLLGTELLEWTGWPTWKATLAASLAVAAGSAVKEFALDDFASGSDLMADGVGIGANGLFQFTIRF